MKKSNLVLLIATTLMSMTMVKSNAQTDMNNIRNYSANEDGIFSKPLGGTSGAVNLNAVKNFEREYRHTSKAEWTTLSDNSLLCRFNMNNILYKAIYTAHGQWKYTTSGYDASKLDKEIYDQVKSVYYNSRIVFVNQVDLANSKTIYIVEIQDEKSIRKIRVQGDEMEIIQELDKQ